MRSCLVRPPRTRLRAARKTGSRPCGRCAWPCDPRGAPPRRRGRCEGRGRRYGGRAAPPRDTTSRAASAAPAPAAAPGYTNCKPQKILWPTAITFELINRSGSFCCASPAAQTPGWRRVQFAGRGRAGVFYSARPARPARPGQQWRPGQSGPACCPVCSQKAGPAGTRQSPS